MKLRQIGEINLLKKLSDRYKTEDNTSLLVGIGDDAAVIAPQNRKIIITTDMMNEGIHFDMAFSSPYNLGFKLVSVNVSDIYAMGGSPEYLFLDISIKGDMDEGFFWSLFDGISDAMSIYGVRLAGGDLCATRNDMVLAATVIGFGDRIITRKGATVGDKIYVTGNLGDSSCGLEILKRLSNESIERLKNKDTLPKPLEMKDSGIIIDQDIAKPLINRHLMPVARNSYKFADYASSMIDISDGLFIDLIRICEESKVGAKVYLDKIPVSDEMKKASEIMGYDYLHFATAGGEDYEILFTASYDFDIQDIETKITCIGEITQKDRIVVDKLGRSFPMKSEGYQHFGIT